MKIGVVGLGYVGLTVAVVLANQGNRVVGVDINTDTVKMLKEGQIHFYEPGLQELLNTVSKRMEFSTDYKALGDSKVIFVAVPTPTRKGKIDLSYVSNTLRSIKRVNMKCIVVIRSTVVPGTATKFALETGLNIASNPEFTRAGSALRDSLDPDKVVIGTPNKQDANMLEKIWKFTKAPVIKTTRENAEMIKYANNTFHATKVSFINELANVCEKIPGCDIEVVAYGLGLYDKIAPKFLKAGLGFGGSCILKDSDAFVTFAKEVGEETPIISAAIEINNKRADRVLQLIKKHTGDTKFKKTRIGVLGVSFKKNTDDTRDSSAVKLIKMLHAIGIKVNYYDPVVKWSGSNMGEQYQSLDECIKHSDVIVIATDWDEFKRLPKSAANKLVIDTRRVTTNVNLKNFKAIGTYTKI